MEQVKADVQISIEDSRWKKVLDEPIERFIETHVASTLNFDRIINTIPTHVEVSVVLTNDYEIKELNREYRGKDKATNVLSFSQETDLFNLKDLNACVLLGDIVLSIETIQLEAEQQHKLMQHHLAHLIVHSTLHLIGYDHETDSDAQVMESLEIDILHQHGISNPYESDTAFMV
jgi:probable rRNA maturation factor